MAIPADAYHTLVQLNTFFQSLTITMLGMSGEKTAWDAWQAGGRVGVEPTNPYYFVRQSWPVDGAPAWQISENVAFIRVIDVDNPINRQRDIERTPVTDATYDEAAGFTRVIECSWMLYGPDSYDRAQLIRDRLFRQTTWLALGKERLHFVPDMQAPRRFPELFQGQWWERTDLKASFNELVVRHTEETFAQSLVVGVSTEADSDAREIIITHNV